MHLLEVKYRSFYIGNDLQCKYLSVYLNLDNIWFEFTVSDGIFCIKKVESVETFGDKGDVYYPISDEIDLIDVTELGELLSIKKYVLGSNFEECNGFLFIFKNKLFSLIENDDEDELKFVLGLDISKINHFDLVKVDLSRFS